MRTKIFVVAILSVFLLGFSACKLGGDANYSPKLSVFEWAKVNSDSLKMKQVEDGVIKFDSLHVNDTVTISIQADAFANYLTKFEYSADKDTVLEVLVVDSVKAFFNEEKSDFAKGKLVLKENIYAMRYPFKFVTTKPTDKVKLLFQVESTAENVPNKNGLILEFPIKP